MRFRVTAIFLSVLTFVFARTTVLSSKSSGAGGPGDQADRLGSVSFPISCSEAIQGKFNTAVAWLHSFEYASAKRAFEEVARQDPHCAMAYWGEAMSLYHQLWDWPNRKTRKQGWAAIEKAKSLGAKTEREREYIAAIEVLYRDPDKGEQYDRAAAYASAMETVYRHNPDDREAAAFYGLALIAEEPPKDDPLTNRKKAGAILEKVFAEVPNHPGAAHYLIHAYDTPELAQMGLEAARRYAKIAPSSAHALHMPSHIFSDLGLWQDSIESNLASAAAAAKATSLHMEDAGYELHAMDFLHYAYLQTGQDAASRRVIADLNTVPGASADDRESSLAEFQAREALELHNWAEAASLKPPEGRGVAGARSDVYWVRAIGAARSGDVVGAREALKKMNAAHDELRSKGKMARRKEPDVDQQEAAAWAAFAEGRQEEALKTLRAAADREDATGGVQLQMPAREMLGDMLLELKQPAAALVEYEAALKRSPDRFDELYGAARAAELAGNAEKAKKYYAALVELTAHADGNRAELQQARVYLARK